MNLFHFRLVIVFLANSSCSCTSYHRSRHVRVREYIGVCVRATVVIMIVVVVAAAIYIVIIIICSHCLLDWLILTRFTSLFSILLIVKMLFYIWTVHCII